MTAVLLTPLTGQFFDNNGNPLNGGLVYSYVAGTSFGTPLATYTDATGTIPAANPVVLNSAGRADIWGAGTYDFKITDSVGNIIDTISSVTAIFGSGDMTKAVYDPANISQQLVGISAVQTITNKTLSSPILITPNIGAATATSLNLGGANPLATYTSGPWTPVWTSLTVSGTPTYTGRYVRTGRFVECSLEVKSTTSTSSTAGTTFFTGLPTTVSAISTITAINASTLASLGVGAINLGSQVFTPTWSAVSDVYISFSYITATD